MSHRARISAIALVLISSAAAPLRGQAVVHYQRGREVIHGVQLLQAFADSTAYYYVPQVPRLATRPDGTFELLVQRYVGTGDRPSGGVFHALVEFSLPPEHVDTLLKQLRRRVPGARIIGPVPLRPATQDTAGGGTVSSFELVSAILEDTLEGRFGRNVLTSGVAPVLPGSRAAVAAHLSPDGIALLWESMKGRTSDVSVAIRAYYDAVADGYNAKVTADVSVVYQHFSELQNIQGNYTRHQIRTVVDTLRRDGTLSVEVLDLTEGTSISSSDMEGILDLVTQKLVEAMFDPELGWARDPEREVAVEPGQVPGRRREGLLTQVFGAGFAAIGAGLFAPFGASDTEYYTDHQYVLKQRQDIRQSTFLLLLSKRAVVSVPIDAAGNLGGVYHGTGSDSSSYFQTVRLDEPTREVTFQLAPDYVEAFEDLINLVTVSVRKSYRDQPELQEYFTIGQADVSEGGIFRRLTTPRLGATGPGIEYQTVWSLRGGITIKEPQESDGWIEADVPAVSLAPPLERRTVTIARDPDLFGQSGVTTAVIQFATVVGGEVLRARRVRLSASDADPTVEREVVLYHDPNEPVAYRVFWAGPGGSWESVVQILEGEILYVRPPDET